MKINISLFILLSTLFFAFTLPAGPDDKAARILKASEEKLNNLDDFQAEFSYVIDNPSIERKPAAREGSLKYKKGMYAILLKDQEIYCDLETVWMYLKDEDAPEVSIMNYDPEENMNMETIFSVYKYSSKAQYRGIEKVHNKNCHKIYVAISEPELDYNQAYVWVNSANNLPEKVTLIDRRQTATTYEFSDFELNSGLKKTDFQFDVNAHEGIDIYDER